MNNTYKIRTIEEVRTLIEYIIEAETEEEAKNLIRYCDDGKVIDEDLTYYEIISVDEM